MSNFIVYFKNDISMNKIKILWADDEIDLLKPHIIFLEQKGYEIKAVLSGKDAIEEIGKQEFNIIFLDEKMPGLSGLETLIEIKSRKPNIPVVMVTKTEDEFTMNDAIGSQISDYLIKPVNPKQLWLTIKKHVDNKRLVSEKITSLYQQNFRELAMIANENLDVEGWKDLYKKMIFWDIELEKSDDQSLREIFDMQKSEVNANFCRFVENNYSAWLNDQNAPLLSHKLMLRKVFPLTDKNKPVVFVIIDNFRYDQWKYIQSEFEERYKILEDDLYFSILPTATNYARNSIFSGMLPSEIEKAYPDLWLNDIDKGGKNQSEEKYILDFAQRLRKKLKISYTKITSFDAGKKLIENAKNLMHNDLIIIVYNFVDLLSHVRTEMEAIKELAEDEAAYRSLTKTWFSHSPLNEVIRKFSEQDCYLVLSTDHGSIRVNNPSKVVGDRNTTTNLRYKHGKNLNFQHKEVLYIKDPGTVHLPAPNISSSFIFAKEDNYFIYPNNFNYYVGFYNNTFQHGGISLEEMFIPVITMESK
jgi:DNA-binding response OmpR family regulator